MGAGGLTRAGGTYSLDESFSYRIAEPRASGAQTPVSRSLARDGLFGSPRIRVC